MPKSRYLKLLKSLAFKERKVSKRTSAHCRHEIVGSEYCHKCDIPELAEAAERAALRAVDRDTQEWLDWKYPEPNTEVRVTIANATPEQVRNALHKALIKRKVI